MKAYSGEATHTTSYIRTQLHIFFFIHNFWYQNQICFCTNMELINVLFFQKYELINVLFFLVEIKLQAEVE
jgi:hypothetical protein